MAYDNNIPQPGDIISTSQAQILANFSTLDTSFAINHIAFSESTNAGKHKFCTLIDQTAAPTTAANEIALYSKAVSGVSTLYFSPESAGTEIIMSGTPPTVAASGSTFLPGGVILKWGTGTAGTAVTFGTAFPNNCYSVVVTTQAAETAISWIYVTARATTGFNTKDLNTWGFQYIAIGN